MSHPSVLAELDEHQRAAVKAPLDCHVLVTAPPGSGKTRVLTARYCHLVASGVAPGSIVAVTFTNKAAGEMKERIGAALGIGREQIRRLPIATFHSLAARWLRRYAPLVGCSPAFSIYDEDESLAAMGEVQRELRLAVKPEILLDAVVYLKDCGVPPEEAAVAEALAVSKRRLAVDADLAAGAYTAYQSLLRRMNAMDFGDLLLYLLEAMEHAPLARRLGVAYLLVDECQDINTVQYALIRRFADAGARVYMVGDLMQCVYSWRGSRPDLVREFLAEYRPEHHRLVYNYRSREAIVAVSSEVIRPVCAQFGLGSYEARSVREGGEVRWFNVPPTGDRCGEPSFAARLVQGLVASGVAPSSVAVLCRYHAPLKALWRQLVTLGVPARLVGGRRSLATPLRYFLAAVLNPADQVALRELLKLLSGVGPRLAERVAGACRQVADVPALVRALEEATPSLPKRAADSARYLAGAIRSLEAAIVSPPPCATAADLVNEAIEDLIEAVPALERHAADLVLVLETAERYPANREGLLELASFLCLMGTDAAKQKERFVPLSTIHAAKGLEYDTVVILDPSIRRERRRDPEERRLFYVALTRAAERAYVVTYALRSWANDPSTCFVRDMLRGTGVEPLHLVNEFMCDMAIADAC